jgi:hypothetical protein
MKNSYYIFLLLLLFCIGQVSAGNPERVGTAGATQLLINPYARSSGVGGLNIATCYGAEAMINNVAGLALTRKTEAIFAHSTWLRGANVGLNTFGFSQRIGEDAGVMGLQVMASSFGDLVRTTVDNPDGNLGTFSPTFLNITLGYAKMMVSDRIYVGASLKLVHESLPDITGNGIALDGGVLYRNADGKFRLGVSLRNIGPTMTYRGDGLGTRANIGGRNSPFDNAVQTIPATMQLPTVLSIGTSYNLTFGDTICGERFEHAVIPMLSFISNAFSYDQIGLGGEYRYRDMIMIRAAYLYETDIFSQNDALNALSGLTLGGTLEIPFGKRNETTNCRNSTIALDYSYRHNYYFSGTHSFGLRFNL